MPANSTHKNIADAVVTGIVALALTDYPNSNVIGSDRVLARWGIETEPKKLPCIFVVPTGTWSVVGGTNERDDISYPMGIFPVDRQAIEKAEFIDTALYWVQQIRKKFIYQRLSTYAWNCLVDPAPVLDTAVLKGFELICPPVFLRFISRETRG
jgi:hypothetical protein